MERNSESNDHSAIINPFSDWHSDEEKRKVRKVSIWEENIPK